MPNGTKSISCRPLHKRFGMSHPNDGRLVSIAGHSWDGRQTQGIRSQVTDEEGSPMAVARANVDTCSRCHERPAATASSTSSTLPTLIRSMASHTPDNVALSGEVDFTYCKMQQLIDDVANQLVESGLQAGDVVGIHTNLSELAPILILGVMTVAGVYLPVDPIYTDLQNTRIEEHLNLRIIISRWEPQKERSRIRLRIERVTANPNKRTERGFRRTAMPCDPAYAMFTSGSTGCPKGVLLGHAGLAQYAQALTTRISMAPRDICIGIAPLGFSSSIRQLLLPLTCGATVVVPNPIQIRTPWGITDLIRAKRISQIDTTPSYWKALVDSTHEDELRSALNSVKRVLFASECLEPDLARDAIRIAPNAAIWNMYGSTETTGIVTAYKLTGVEPRERPIPIGTGLSHVSVTLAPTLSLPTASESSDDQIIVDGPAVCLGRLDDTADTQQSALGCTSRSTSMGDLAKLSDGELVWTGRADRQVKVRGMRVSPEAIEQRILEYPGVRRAAVAYSNELGIQCIVEATTQSVRLDAQRMKLFLRTRLPAHMIPVSIGIATEWPCLPNGKTDMVSIIQLINSPAYKDAQATQKGHPDS